MKLQQLQYVIAVVDNNLSITTAAKRIYTSQPGISKQIKLLEEELNAQIFHRKGKLITGLTEVGSEILERARKIVQEVNNIQQLSCETYQHKEGSLTVATSQTQAQYVLPQALTQFHEHYPNLKIDLRQATAIEIIEDIKNQKVDFAIASGNDDLGPEIIKIPCYQWDKIAIFPQDHELGDLKDITLSDITKHPILTYKIDDEKHSTFLNACKEQNITPNVVFTARDADIIKTYVRKGFGVGLIAHMAFDNQADSDLIGYSTKHILPATTTWIAFNKNTFLRKYMKEFIKICVPHLTSENLDKILAEEHNHYSNSLEYKKNNLYLVS